MRRDFKALGLLVALRKESVDRNSIALASMRVSITVALRKESVDRNASSGVDFAEDWLVALRKESVDRNLDTVQVIIIVMESLSARRAWIEIQVAHQ